MATQQQQKKATAPEAAVPAATTALVVGPGASITPLVQGVERTMAPIRARLGGEEISPFDLPKIKVPTGGSVFWLVPSVENPDGMPSKEIRGVIVWTSIGRAKWNVPFEQSNGGGPPDCSSADGITGVGDPGGDCHSCPFAQWGSDAKGRGGQECSKFRSILLLTEGSNLPVRLQVPPSSLGSVRKYLLGLDCDHWQAVTAFSLVTAASKVGAVPFSKIVPRSLGQLSPELQANAAEWHAMLQAAKISAVDVDRADVESV